jgi:hypothetical protein
MTRRTFSISTIVFAAAAAFSADPALAQRCVGGKVPTTIINPAGKAIEICVAPAAIPSIGGGGDIVIPAICPCFSQEDITSAFVGDPTFVAQSFAGTTSITNEPCTLAIAYNASLSGLFEAAEGPLDDKTSGRCIYPTPELRVAPNNYCVSSSIALKALTEAEGDACVGVLKTFVPK